MSSTTLVLKNDGANFEKMYYLAVCMGEKRAAEKKFALYNKAPTATFWRDAFRESKLPETVLMSAIINLLDMPFGSYMFKQLNDDVIEIATWLYGDSEFKQTLIDAITSETQDAKALYTHARTIQLAANFFEWLARYRKFEEATHG